jgi:hypothetical protein
MIEIWGSGFLSIARGLEYTKWIVATGRGGEQECKVAAGSNVATLLPRMEGLPLPVTFEEQVKRLHARLIEGRLGREALVALIEEVQDSLRSELDQHVFCWVSGAGREAFSQQESWFGESVVAKYEDARRDMRDCARCYGLEQWTASVFHAMGVMEYGLRDLAGKVSVSFSTPIELENWHNIIEAIEKKLKDTKRLPKGQRDDTLIEFAAKAASHFFAVKEAWRNHVSHTRGRYDEVEAVKIVTNVRDFMKVLAS